MFELKERERERERERKRKRDTLMRIDSKQNKVKTKTIY
jgi:hypothetical protein